MSPRIIALLLRGRDSRLVRSGFDAADQEPVLAYTFDVAGMTRSFRLAVTSDVLQQVAELYPAAAVEERCLVEQFGLRLLPCAGAEAKPDADGVGGTTSG